MSTRYSGKWVYPVDPDCPQVKRFLTVLLGDPMTKAMGAPVDEIIEDFEREHRIKCKRCQRHGMENIGVAYNPFRRRKRAYTGLLQPRTNPSTQWHIDRLVRLTNWQAGSPKHHPSYLQYTHQLKEEEEALREAGLTDAKINELKGRAEFLNPTYAYGPTGFRPPKRWWNKMLAEARDSYRKRAGQSEVSYKAALSRIVGGIWSRFEQKTREKILRRYEPMAVGRARNPGAAFHQEEANKSGRAYLRTDDEYWRGHHAAHFQSRVASNLGITNPSRRKARNPGAKQSRKKTSILMLGLLALGGYLLLKNRK